MDVVDVTEQMMAEFEDRAGLDVITGVVNRCRHDLSGVPAGALPELLERLARQRLSEAVGAGRVVPLPRSAARSGLS